MSFERYAVYFVPPRDSELAAFGREWLGVDVETGELIKQTAVKGITKSRFNALTIAPRSYGFHGTLKPPFELGPGASLEGLLDVVRLYANGTAPAEVPPIEVGIIGKFIALIPIHSSSALEDMASGLVRSLEGFRKRKSIKELAQYRQSKLTVHQDQMLDHWGYPFVLEEFRFHFTVTDRIDDEKERNILKKAAEERLEGVIGKPIPVADIAVCGQDSSDQIMRVIERFPLGVKT